MELLDRYLQAVRFWLPKAQGEDIVAELSEDLRSQIEEKESALGRKLNESEIAILLKQSGRPVLVANRFLPQEHLIGPVLFPVYRFVLKIVAACYLLPWILVWIGFMVFAPGYGTSRSGGSWIKALGAFWAAFWLVACVAIGVVTIVFAVLEKVQARSGFLEKWNPLKLPALRHPNRIPRSTSVFELVLCTVFCFWWVAAMRSPVVLDQPGIRITLAPVWLYFFCGNLLLSLANIAASGVNLLRPYWTRRRAALRLLTDGLGAALFCALCRSDILAEISLAKVSSTRALEITQSINAWLSKSLPFVVLIGLVIMAFNVRRIIRVKPTDTRLPGSMASGGLPTSALV